MSQAPVDLKGSAFTLSVVQLNSDDITLIYQTLKEKVQQAPAFFKNAPVVMNVSQLASDADFKAIRQAISQAGLAVVGASGYTSQEQRENLLAARLAPLTEGKSLILPEVETTEVVKEVPTFIPAMILDTPIRGGQQIYARHCDLIITNHVNPGAEIIADGNIHVYGHLRGRALAGADGNDKAQIFCTQLAAELVSIAGQYWLSENIPNEYYDKAVNISIKDSQLTIKNLK